MHITLAINLLLYCEEGRHFHGRRVIAMPPRVSDNTAVKSPSIAISEMSYYLERLFLARLYETSKNRSVPPSCNLIIVSKVWTSSIYLHAALTLNFLLTFLDLPNQQYIHIIFLCTISHSTNKKYPNSLHVKWLSCVILNFTIFCALLPSTTFQRSRKHIY